MANQDVENQARAPLTRPAAPADPSANLVGCHARAASAADTDWSQIAENYGILLRDTPSPMVALNHVVAIAMRDGPDAGLALLEPLEAAGALAGHHLLAATRADLQRRAGRTEQAVAAYDTALTCVRTEPERRYLRRRIAELGGAGTRGGAVE